MDDSQPGNERVGFVYFVAMTDDGGVLLRLWGMLTKGVKNAKFVPVAAL